MLEITWVTGCVISFTSPHCSSTFFIRTGVPQIQNLFSLGSSVFCFPFLFLATSDSWDGHLTSLLPLWATGLILSNLPGLPEKIRDSLFVLMRGLVFSIKLNIKGSVVKRPLLNYTKFFT